jgi:uncharacterized protein (DUF58 family)
MVQPHSAHRLHHSAEAAASRLPPLMVAAERVASTVAQGVHGRRRVGQGETFWQYRPYADGDSAQRIDWRQSAKSDRIFVRETEWEAAQTVWIARDPSASMDYASDPGLPTKRETADLLALAVAVLLVRGGERVALYGSGAPPGSGRATLLRMARMLSAGEGAMPAAGDAHPVARFGHMVCVGDFLEPRENVADWLRHMAARGVRGQMVHIIDPAEARLPFEGRVRYDGLEGEQPLIIGRTESVRDDYRAFFDARIEALRAFAQQAGWRYERHTTDRPAEPTLLEVYAGLGAVGGGAGAAGA